MATGTRSLSDGMADIITKIAFWRGGQGTGYGYTVPLSNAEIESAYLGSGMMRKCINIPAQDAVRDWREWQSEADEITKIHEEEKRLKVQNLILRMEVLRGLGGGALIMGLPGEPSQPAPANIKPGQLAFINVVNRWQITLGDKIDDPNDLNYGEPVKFTIQTNRGPVDIHPSRVIAFKGEPTPNLISNPQWADEFWGESQVAALKEDVENYDAVKRSLLRMVSKAAYMRIGIPNLSDSMSTTAGQALIFKRTQAIATGTTTFDAVVYDMGNGQEGSGEKIEDATITLTGVIDTVNGFAQQIAAVADIPFTRLMSESAKGLNSSGNGEQKDWNKKVGAKQTLHIDPCLAQLDVYLLQSAGVADASYTWPSLSQPSQAEEATRFKTVMDGVKILQETGTIPDEALSKGVQSWMVEEGFLPGLEQALEDIPEAERYGLNPDVDETDPSALTEGGDPAPNGGGAVPTAPRRAANDKVKRK